MDSDIRLLLSKTEDFAMTEKQKKMLGRIIAAFVLFVALLIAEHTGMLENVNVWIQFVIYLVPYLIIGMISCTKQFEISATDRFSMKTF